MSGNQQQFEKRLRTALQDQAKHTTLSDDELQRMALAVVRRVRTNHVTHQRLRDLWQLIWYGKTFIPLGTLFRVGAAAVILIAVLLLYVSGTANVGMPTRARADEGISTLLMEEAPPFTAGPGKGW